MILGVNPYLVTNGNGNEAVEFYKASLGATVQDVRTFADMPESPDFKVPEEVKNYILHAHLKIGDADLMISDTFPGQPHNVGDNITIAIHLDNVEEAKELFAKLQDGGNVIMELQETFWSPGYGQLVDKFGISWQLNVHLPSK
ncbi:VOC family protein [Priestia taiwanensis]|uniref:VOC family protein n=1 Tax=Priestia taiwanensis TaxID=1347902 RepID=A0A917AMD1_9BACI|nr:VOC family protein [Priestia taiwanensis]MBM7362244.1 PhnB protein [Priestia taiwanensis]GGE60588.1 VOC family protein [Priestia taiwanensis]